MKSNISCFVVNIGDLTIAPLKGAFAAIKSHIFLFLAIFLLEIVFFVALFGFNYAYQLKALIAAQDVLSYIEQQPLDEPAMASGITSGQNSLAAGQDILESILGDNPAMIHQKYLEIANALLYLLLFNFLLFAVFNGFIWNLTDLLVRKSDGYAISDFRPEKAFGFFRVKGFFIYQLKFFLIALAYALIAILLLYLIIKIFMQNMTEESLEGLRIPISLLVFILPLLYFAYITFPLIGIAKFRDIAKKTFSIGVKKFPGVMLTYIINLVVIAAFLLILYFSAEMPVPLLILFSLMLILAIAWCRVFLICSVIQLKSVI